MLFRHVPNAISAMAVEATPPTTASAIITIDASIPAGPSAPSTRLNAFTTVIATTNDSHITKMGFSPTGPIYETDALGDRS